MRILSPRMQRLQAVQATKTKFFLTTGEPLQAEQGESLRMSSVSLTIRDFHKADFETLWRIDQSCFSPGISYSRLELAAYVRSVGAFTLVAELTSAGEAVGFDASHTSGQTTRQLVGFVVARASRGAGHIITIDVLPKAQRTGVGSCLLSTAEVRLREKHCTFVKLETSVDNTSALSFYKRHQYFVVRTLPRYYPDGTSAFVLRKELLPERQPDNLRA
jgi:[ribosomal protein S18]-alanine N-acetyltransferase